MRLAALRILRPGNALMTAVAVVVAAFVAGGYAGLGAHAAAVVAGAVSAFAFAGAGNAANDVRDVAIDRRAHPDRPLVTGELTLKGARRLVVALYVTSLVGAVVVGTSAVLLVVAALVLMETYEITLKRRGLPGNVAVGALTGAPFVLGGLAVGALPLTLWALAALAALATLGREILKDVEDAEADAAARRRTLPLRVGERRAARAGSAALLAAVLLSPAPFLLEILLGWPYLPVVAAADAGFLAAAFLANRPDRAQRLAKASMAIALLAFVVGKLAAEGWVPEGVK